MTYINAYSGHADMADLDGFVCAVQGLQKLILVHGESEQMQPFADRVSHVCGGTEVLMPEREQIITL